MTFKLRVLALGAACALATSALAPSTASAAALKPGSYSMAGIQNICIVNGGSWYGEEFPFNGNWVETPSGDTAIFGNYASGAGNDSMIVTRKAVQWTEWRDDLSFQNFVTGAVVRLGGRCSPPATLKSTRNNPQD